MLKLWDLRKSGDACCSKIQKMSGPVGSIAFDFTGSFLAVACGEAINVVGAKNLKALKEITGHSKSVTGVALSRDARTLISSSMDRALKFYSCA